MFWIALAAQLSAPTPRGLWFQNTDTPVAELSTIGHARVLIRITVDPKGSLLSCDVEQSSGNETIDAQACIVTMKRAHFKAARTVDGAATYGVRRLPVVWLMEPMNLPPQGDLIVPVDQLPSGINSPAVVGLVFAADSSGHVSSCAADNKNRALELVSLACDRLQKEYRAIPAKAADGTVVPSVQNALVLVEVK